MSPKSREQKSIGTRWVSRSCWGVALASLAFASLASAQQQQNSQQLPGQMKASQQMDTLAVVNGHAISRQQVATQCVRRFGADVLKNIIKKQLVYNECIRLGINITEKDINDEITARAAHFKMAADHWVNMICSRRNITPDRLKNDLIWNDVALRRLAADQIQVQPEDLQRQVAVEYGQKVQVREIVCSDLAMANKLMPMVRGPNAQDFGTVAKDHSMNPISAAVRGLLPPVPRFVSSNPKMENLIFSLQPGQVSDPVQVADDQVVILKCERIFPATELNDDQLAAVHERMIKEITETKLSAAAQVLGNRLQKEATIVNVHNDPQLSAQMPGVAAMVNGVKITKRYLAEQCIEQFGLAILSSEINRSILVQALQQRSLQVTPEDVENEILEAAALFGHRKPDGTVNRDAWLEFITRGDLAKVDFYIEDEVWPSVALKILVREGVQVTQADMQKGFEANFGPRVEALAMVFNDSRQATRVWQMAMANPTAEYFGKLANQYSVEPASQANFGEVPPIQRHGGRQQLEEEAFSLKPGEISKVVQVGEHYVVLMCRGMTTPRITEIDAVKDQLHRDIYDKKIRIAMAEYMGQLTVAAQIDNFLAGTSQAGAASRTANGGSNARVPFKSRR